MALNKRYLCRVPKLFPSAAQPDIVRAAQKVSEAWACHVDQHHRPCSA